MHVLYFMYDLTKSSWQKNLFIFKKWNIYPLNFDSLSHATVKWIALFLWHRKLHGIKEQNSQDID